MNIWGRPTAVCFQGTERTPTAPTGSFSSLQLRATSSSSREMRSRSASKTAVRSETARRISRRHETVGPGKPLPHWKRLQVRTLEASINRSAQTVQAWIGLEFPSLEITGLCMSHRLICFHMYMMSYARFDVFSLGSAWRAIENFGLCRQLISPKGTVDSWSHREL